MRRCSAAYLALVLFLFSCKKEVGRVNFGSYPDDIGGIIRTNCAVSGCHTTESKVAAGNLDLSSWSAMFSGSNRGLAVVPFSSRFSALAYFVNTYPSLGPTTEPTMPLNKPPLSYSQVLRIHEWINSGAPDKDGNVAFSGSSSRKKLYAVNQGCDVVTVFDSETKLPVRYIEVGNKPGPDTPHQLRVSPDGIYWYVIFLNNNIMQKFRCDNDSYVGDIPLTPVAAGLSTDATEDAVDWNTFVITPDGKSAYCVSWQERGKISWVDLQERKLIKFLGGQHWPHGITLDPATSNIYVASQTGNFVTRWNYDLTDSKEIPLESTINYNSSLDPHDMVLSPDGASLFITCQGTDEVRVLDLSIEEVLSIIPTGDYPQEIVYSQTGNQYFVSCPGVSPAEGSKGIVTRIDVSRIATNIECGFQPHGIAVDENKKVLYVLSRNIAAGGPVPHHSSACGGRNGFVNFIDLNSHKVLPEQFELSTDPYFIFARP
jgi:YVTN family beta-propeller protein